MSDQLTIYGQLLFAAGQGAGTATFTEEASGYVRDRYFDWIVTDQPGRGTPAAAWSAIASAILDRSRAVGALAAAQSPGGVIGRPEIEAACIAVEEGSNTDWCPSRQD